MSATIWDFWARRYDRLWVQRVSLGPTRRLLMERIPDMHGRRLLDVGCGTGQLYGALEARYGAAIDYQGVDASAAMIAVARGKYPKVPFSVCRVENFSLAPATFDVIVCAHAFPYFADKVGALQLFHRLLKPGGTLLLAQASTNGWYDRVVLGFVKLSTSPAEYLSRAALTAMAAPVFAGPPLVHRVNRSALIPSLDMFEWKKREGGA